MDDRKREQLKSVVKGKSRAGKNAGRIRFSDVFLPDDITSVREYIITDVLVPLIKTALLNSVETLLYGGSSNSRRRSSSRPASMVSYRACYDDPDDRFYSRRSRVRNVNRFHNDDVSFDTEDDAAKVLEMLEDVIDRYNFASVQDLYEFAELTAPYTSNRYGWSNLSSTEIVCVRIDGELRWILKLPKAVPIG